MADTRFHIRQVAKSESDRLEQFWRERWGAPIMVSRGHLYHARDFDGIVAVDTTDEWLGLITYRLHNGECEVMSFDSLAEGIGIGTALLDAVVALARSHGVQRLWLITTNDNTPALRFYQRRGWRLVGLYPNSIIAARTLKPEIPELGVDGIAIRDELELELPL